VWLHQCGSLEEARAAAAAGADGLIVQGVEAGGHVRGTVVAHELLARVRSALGSAAPPLLVAGGIAERADVAAALEAGAAAATERWLRGDPRGPLALRALNRASGVGARRVPPAVQARLAAAQRPDSRLLTPVPATDDGPPGLVEAGPLYAGATVARIRDVRPAAELVAALTP
jgi:nitronate monooxygenase